MWVRSQDNNAWINIDTGRKVIIKEEKINKGIKEVNGNIASFYYETKYCVYVDDVLICSWDDHPSALDFVLKEIIFVKYE